MAAYATTTTTRVFASAEPSFVEDGQVGVKAHPLKPRTRSGSSAQSVLSEPHARSTAPRLA